MMTSTQYQKLTTTHTRTHKGNTKFNTQVEHLESQCLYTREESIYILYIVMFQLWTFEIFFESLFESLFKNRGNKGLFIENYICVKNFDFPQTLLICPPFENRKLYVCTS